MKNERFSMFVGRFQPFHDGHKWLIEQRLKLRNPIYSETAAYGHMGRHPQTKTIRLRNGAGEILEKEVETFTWEKLDYVEKVQAAFGL